MSIQLCISELTDEQRIHISTHLPFQHPTNEREWIHPYDIDEQEQYIYIPYQYGIQLGVSPRSSRHLPRTQFTFQGELREYQRHVRKETIQKLQTTGSIVLSLHVGWGKSVFAIYLAYKLRYKTLILVNRIVLARQWVNLIHTLSDDVKVQFLQPRDGLDEHADIVVMNAMNVQKRGRDTFSAFGVCIADEIHLICAATLYKSMYSITPRYLIGLSATPTRPDGLDHLIDLYFGTNRITRTLDRFHAVYPVFTGYTLEYELNGQGRMDWNSLLNAQAYHHERNTLIVDMIRHFPERCFLVLCKRIQQGMELCELLMSMGESVTDLLGSKKEFDADARILIATTQKCGVGFSHDRLDTLLLASDIEEYFIQYLGRVFRRPDINPVVFDLVDANPILQKHYRTRKAVYQQSGGHLMKRTNPQTILKMNLNE